LLSQETVGFQVRVEYPPRKYERRKYHLEHFLIRERNKL